MSSFEEKVKALSVVMVQEPDPKVGDLTSISIERADQIEASIRNFQEKTQIDIINKTSRRDMESLPCPIPAATKLASDYVNSLVRRYIEENLTLKRAEAYGASQFLVDQIATFKIKPEKIESAIAGSGRTERCRTSISLYDQLQPCKERTSSWYCIPKTIRGRCQGGNRDAQRFDGNRRPAAGPDMALDWSGTDTTKKIYEDLLSTLRGRNFRPRRGPDKAGAFRLSIPR
jgi:hypothetical protein